MTERISSAEDFRSYFDVSRETMERLEVYAALLEKWNPKINLVSRSTLENMWLRHFADSAQIWYMISENPQHWLDIGSGAGFPGLVIAAIAAEKAPEMAITLVESDQRKSVFMRTVAREMGVKATVLTERIENLPPQNADVLSARALSSLTNLLEFAEKHRISAGTCLFPKGANVDSELTEAALSWHISPEKLPSMTDSNAVILRIGEFHRA